MNLPMLFKIISQALPENYMFAPLPVNLTMKDMAKINL